MGPNLKELEAFVAVVEAGGFRDAARAIGSSPCGVSEAVRRLEARTGVRLLHRTTRSVTTTEAGARLLARLKPALDGLDAALDVVNGFRDKPVGKLKLNVPVVAAKLILPRLVPAFLAAYPDIELEVIADDGFIDLMAEGCDAGIRYGERLEQDMIAVPIGPREQRMALGASPAYLERRGRPQHPSELLQHACVRYRFASGAMTTWEFERDGEHIRVEPSGPLIVRAGAATDLGIDAALAGCGIVQLFDDWMKPFFENGSLEPVLEPWWQRFPGPFLYYSGHRYVPTPLRAFLDFIRSASF
ncbi:MULTISPECIES: LysR family transcriptional regulator [unclassified Caballeronia]|uniref:LysR family transcriptional regulator n=1 Tax=unclassified Caballeronia TaxID=2646786 RepID=UPI002855CF99|nr:MULTISPECIES: LysR family transcriptional regulator [unclassified Caballeronia]MDR5774958.1 LysR family transcriptional regulator [Caballeronia sp. LZ002]MDR5850394.1 LysR family transcriptional regulator [Caballeronia sp. LZ003]